MKHAFLLLRVHNIHLNLHLIFNLFSSFHVIYSWFINSAVSSSDYTAPNVRILVNKELDNTYVQLSGRNLINVAIIPTFVLGTEANHENLGQDSRPPGRYLNSVIPEYEGL
jgi:hypothetical protein